MSVRSTVSNQSSRMDTHNFASVILVAIGFHVPDDLMAEQLRNLGCFEDEALHIAYDTISVKADKTLLEGKD